MYVFSCFSVLCGRRKGNIILLGGAWNQDVDGGNPLEDRKCLYNTARRLVLAQSLLDISVSCSVTQVDEFYLSMNSMLQCIELN